MKKFARLGVIMLGMLPVVLFGQALVPSNDAYVVPLVGAIFGTVSTIMVGGSTNAKGLVQFDLAQLPGGSRQAKSRKLLSRYSWITCRRRAR